MSTLASLPGGQYRTGTCTSASCDCSPLPAPRETSGTSPPYLLTFGTTPNPCDCDLDPIATGKSVDDYTCPVCELGKYREWGPGNTKHSHISCDDCGGCSAGEYRKNCGGINGAWSDEHVDSYLADCSLGCQNFPNLHEAKKACDAEV